MILGILKEESPENRVSITPDTLAALKKLGFQQIMVEKGAGERAYYPDAVYEQQGGTITTGEEVLSRATVVSAINMLPLSRLGVLKSQQYLIGQFNPLSDPAISNNAHKTGASVFSLDLLPRSTRAQAMDVLSSMATVAGYKAVLTAAANLPGFFPMFMTAAGTIKPAKVLIIGAGVAGLQAIATAKRLGAVVEAFDVRAAAKEEVLSLGAKFVDVEGAAESAAAGGYAIEQSEEYKQRQAEAVHKHAQQANVIICTAQIPGRKAPLIIRKATVEAMQHGSLVVDLAASSGGNCEVTKNGQTIIHQGVTVIGDSNLPATMPKDASSMFSKNILNFLKILIPKGEIALNFEDDIIANTCISHQGQVISPRLKSVLQPSGQ
jgi:NAD(P) transhydrogenase subunit alpha